MSRGFLFAILTSLIWGLAPAFEKIGLHGRIDPYIGVVIRTIPIVITGFAGLVVMGRIEEMAQVELRNVVFLCIGGLLAGFLGQVAFYSALKNAEASVVVPLAATYPLVALLVSVMFLGEAFTWQRLVGVVFVVSGVILLK